MNSARAYDTLVRPLHPDDFDKWEVEFSGIGFDLKPTTEADISAQNTKIRERLVARSVLRICSEFAYDDFFHIATDFVETSTGLPTADVPITWDLSREGGVFRTDVPSIEIEKPEIMPITLLRYRQLLALAVHEKAHETGIFTRKALSFISRNAGNGEVIIDEVFLTGMCTLNLMDEGEIVIGNFFEEAFAESTAMRWNDEYCLRENVPGYADCREMKWRAGLLDSVLLPRKYFMAADYNTEGFYPEGLSPSDSSIFTPSIAAYGLELLNGCTEVDLYQLIVDARKPGLEASAKREFIKAVNAIQPGLYAKLRNLEYTTEDFTKGLRLIQNAIK